MTPDNRGTAALRAKLNVQRPALAMAAHNPLAAKLAANAGFDAIWGSGFELSASYAVPDANILPMSTHLEMMRAIGQVQDAPVIADLDTGFGNAVNVAYVVPQYAAAGVAAVVIEDKTFPKTRACGRRPPAACADQRIPGQGRGGKSQLRCHDRRSHRGSHRRIGQASAPPRPSLCRSERGGCVNPLKAGNAGRNFGILPSVAWTCAVGPGADQLPAAFVRRHCGLERSRLVICGNHAIRAAVAAMQDVFRRILAEGGIAGVESDIASVADVFALQGDERMRGA